MQKIYSFLKKNKIMSIGIGVVLLLTFLLFGVSSLARYGSKIEGLADLTPARFNVVMLGELPFPDGFTEDSKRSAVISLTDEKVKSFGDSKLSDTERQLYPGEVVLIPITVVNGTTPKMNHVEGDVSNVDIIYSMSLLATGNLPIEYDIYKYTTTTELEKLEALKDYQTYDKEKSENSTQFGQLLTKSAPVIGESKQLGYCKEYVFSAAGNVTNSLNRSAFVLEHDKKDETLSVHRYMLVAYWPDKEPKTSDMAYRQEIELAEVQLEIESWVVEQKATKPDYTSGNGVLLSLNSSPIGEETFYTLPTEGAVTKDKVFARTTVPFYASKEYFDKEGQKAANTTSLALAVTNATPNKAITWVADAESKEKGKYVVDSLITTELKGLSVAVAVPTKKMGAHYNYEEFSYKIAYKGETYVGQRTQTFIQSPTTSYTKNLIDAYELITFSGLKLADFGTVEAIEENLELIITSNDATAYSEYKDDLKIFIYQP